jgi:hypothetical protein
VGAQVIVLFLSDRTASGMVMGTIEGLLSWRRVAAPAFTERMQPHLQETAAKCAGLDPMLTVVEDAFTADQAVGLFAGAIALPDGRVFFVPSAAGAAQGLIRPYLWDPYSGALHELAAPWEAGDGTDFMGGCLLLDGRIFFSPSFASLTAQAYIYDPELDRLVPAGEAVLLGDGRVLLLPGVNGDLVDCRLWDPVTDTYTSVSDLNALPAIGQGAYLGGCVLPDGRVVFAPWYSRHLVVWEPGLGVAYGRDVALAAFWNHRP